MLQDKSEEFKSAGSTASAACRSAGRVLGRSICRAQMPMGLRLASRSPPRLQQRQLRSQPTLALRCQRAQTWGMSTGCVLQSLLCAALPGRAAVLLMVSAAAQSGF